MKLIDKDALVAEIERSKSSFLESEEYNKNEKMQNTQCLYHRLAGFCDDLLSFINSLEVTEVGLNKPFEGVKVQTSMESGSLDEVIVTTKYKAQKGE
jgi:hypothetical protein